jgi:hypothetical protein
MDHGGFGFQQCHLQIPSGVGIGMEGPKCKDSDHHSGYSNMAHFILLSF